MKRIFDVVVSSLALIVLAPVIAGVGLAIRIRLGSPVFFRQERSGKHGETFTLLKFRTMANGDGDDEERTDSFGALVRSSSLDELPELWNVVRGEMSLVGPRPLLPEYIPLYSEAQARRHEVQPGLTGLAQVNGRNSVSWTERFAIDVDYVERQSLRLDVSILWATVKVVLQRRDIAAPGGVAMPPFDGTN